MNKSTRTGSQLYRMLFFITLALGLLLRLVALFRRPLSSDELWDMVLMKNSPSVIISASLADFRPPLPYFLLITWGKIFGDNLTSLRLVSLIVSVITMFLIYKTAYLISTKKQALLVFLLSAIAAGLIYDGVNARTLSISVSLVSIMLYSLVAFFNSGRNRYLLYLILSTIIASYTYYYVLILLPFITGWLYIKKRFPAVKIYSIFTVISTLTLLSGFIRFSKYTSTYHNNLLNHPLKALAAGIIPYIPAELVIFETGFIQNKLPIFTLLVLLILILILVWYKIIPKLNSFDWQIFSVFSILPLILLTITSIVWKPILSVHGIIIFSLPIIFFIPLQLRDQFLQIIFSVIVAFITGYYLLYVTDINPDFRPYNNIVNHKPQLVLVNSVYSLLWLKHLDSKLDVKAYTQSYFNPEIEKGLHYEIISPQSVTQNKLVLIETKGQFDEERTSRFRSDINSNYSLQSIDRFQWETLYWYKRNN